ncbi:MAG: hypothetical protein FRX49_09021 [Trebouxia sp. A1-2]|nr:MAG: hypothetical protein FRX49_09021 [Trebouxia sp. A1-2]
MVVAEEVAAVKVLTVVSSGAAVRLRLPPRGPPTASGGRGMFTFVVRILSSLLTRGEGEGRGEAGEEGGTCMPSMLPHGKAGRVPGETDLT